MGFNLLFLVLAITNCFVSVNDAIIPVTQTVPNQIGGPRNSVVMLVVDGIDVLSAIGASIPELSLPCRNVQRLSITY